VIQNLGGRPVGVGDQGVDYVGCRQLKLEKVSQGFIGGSILDLSPVEPHPSPKFTKRHKFNPIVCEHVSILFKKLGARSRDNYIIIY
jgi:hypothetical protein